MGKTGTLAADPKMDFSTLFRVAEDKSSYFQDHPDVQGMFQEFTLLILIYLTSGRTTTRMSQTIIPHSDLSYLQSCTTDADPLALGSYSEIVKPSSHKQFSRTFPYRRDSDDELASALLNDTTTTMEQQPTRGSRKLPPPQMGDLYASMVERSNGPVFNNAISRANMNAFQANRAQALPPPSTRHKPSTAVQPKTTSRQRKGTARYRRPSRGSSGVGPQQAANQSAWEILDRSDVPQAKMGQPSTQHSQAGTKQMEAPKVHDPNSSNEPLGDRQKFKRQSESILALTDATRLVPHGTMAVRRSKTNRESGKSNAAKQKGVFKKMTNALTDRLHLTHNKVTQVEPHEADELRGSGYYDYETNQFFRDVETDIPAQKPQPPSRLPEIYECERPDQDVQQFSDDSFDWSAALNSESSPSKEFLDDPFADPESVKRVTTEFVSRLKATTPSKSSRDPSPVTPSASPTNMEALLRGSVNSLLPFPPVCASTPRIVVSRRRSHAFDRPIKMSKTMSRMSASVLELSVDLEELAIGSDATSVKDSVDDGHHLAPAYGYTYQPVLNAPDRKKHPSPNKVDLEIMETRLRKNWPETLAQATEKAKKHPSPLKVDIQTLSEQFRKLYPELLGGNTPNQSEKGDGSYCLVSNDDEADELALSFEMPTPAKRVVSRHRKVSSGSCSVQAAASEAKNKRKTIAMSKYAGNMSPVSHLQLACPAYHQA